MVKFASGMLVIQAHNFVQVFVPADSVPVILNSSPAATLIATPKVNPVSTLDERNSEIHPSLNRYMIRYKIPVVSTIAAAMATASSEPALATVKTAAPSTAAVEELGPWVTCFEVVKRANAINPSAAA